MSSRASALLSNTTFPERRWLGFCLESVNVLDQITNHMPLSRLPGSWVQTALGDKSRWVLSTCESGSGLWSFAELVLILLCFWELVISHFPHAQLPDQTTGNSNGIAQILSAEETTFSDNDKWHKFQLEFLERHKQLEGQLYIKMWRQQNRELESNHF